MRVLVAQRTKLGSERRVLRGVPAESGGRYTVFSVFIPLLPPPVLLPRNARLYAKLASKLKTLAVQARRIPPPP